MVVADSLNPTQIGNVTFERGPERTDICIPADKFYSLLAEGVATRKKEVRKKSFAKGMSSNVPQGAALARSQSGK